MHRLRHVLTNAFERPDTRIFSTVNDFLALVTIVSVLAIVLESVAYFAPYHAVFKGIEYTVVAIFTLEYVGRLWITKPHRKYGLSFFGIIDFVAIIPTYFALANFTFLKASRTIRILRFLRMLRLAKLARVHKSDKTTRSLYRLTIQIYTVALFSSILILGLLLSFFEHDQPYTENVPQSMFWVFKVIFGGLPFEQPETVGGLVILSITRFAGMMLFGVLIGLMSTLVRRALIGSESE